MSEQQDTYVSAEELGGSVKAAEGGSDFKPPCDVLLALRPFGRKRITEGVVKPFDAIETYCVEVLEDGSYVDIGLRDVAWQFVMRELDNATEEVPWTVGTITKKSRAYFLVPPTVEQLKAATVAIDALVADRRAEEEAADAVSEAFAGDEEPF